MPGNRARPVLRGPGHSNAPRLPDGSAIQRHRKKGSDKLTVYTYPSKKALLSITAKVRTLTDKAQHHSLADLLGRLNAVLRGWCGYFRHGVSKATFGYLDSYAWHRVTQWLLKRVSHCGHSWTVSILAGWVGRGAAPRRRLADWRQASEHQRRRPSHCPHTIVAAS